MSTLAPHVLALLTKFADLLDRAEANPNLSFGGNDDTIPVTIRVGYLREARRIVESYTPAQTGWQDISSAKPIGWCLVWTDKGPTCGFLKLDGEWHLGCNGTPKLWQPITPPSEEQQP